MSEGDPTLLPAMFLDHVLAGIETLESVPLSTEDRNEAARLALRLIRLSRKEP